MLTIALPLCAALLGLVIYGFASDLPPRTRVAWLALITFGCGLLVSLFVVAHKAWHV